MSPHRLLTGKVVIATHNSGKLVEMRELLAPFGIEAVSAGELGLPEPDETGTMFSENAAIKAEAAARASGLPAFADDSGLCVTALDGAPGLFSARWAGPSKDFAVAMEKVHDAILATGPDAGRDAHFVCALSLCWPDGHIETFEGRADGTLVWPPRGEHGFGYDAMFLPLGATETYGEIDPDAKHAISHRAAAFTLLTAAVF